ncbi:TPA: hypothetical protein HA246_04625 [Candidatus Woesearchaeota archaeon]|nr:hypothetical protein [Candidatus Woesearchaeota archaeon]
MSNTQKVIRDTPLQEITLRRYEKPANLAGRQLLKKLLLSVGLLQPGDSRDVIVDVLYVLLKARSSQAVAGNNSKAAGNVMQNLLSSDDIVKQVIEYRKQENLQLRGIASSNIRRQIKRLRDLYLVEKITNNYRITEHQKLHDTFEEKVEKFMLASMLTRVKEYMHAVDQEFS